MTMSFDQISNCVTEPKWILDRTGSQGQLFWRRETASKNRVKFRFDVEIKEFRRQEHELLEDEPQIPSYLLEESTDRLTFGITCVVFMAVTMFLPWYVIGA